MQLAPSTVLLVSADHINSLGLHALLTEQSNLRLLDDVRQPDVAVQLAARHHPDQIIVDADVDGMGLVPFVRAVTPR